MRLPLLAGAALCVSSLAAHADSISIVLDSVNNGTYSYGLQVASTEDLESGTIIEFNGLYGVTGAVATDGEFTAVVGSTRVRFIQNKATNEYFGDSSDLFEITSTSGVPGVVSYLGVVVTAGDISGTVDGPAPPSVTPEPSGIALLGTGVLGIAGVVRKRFA